jgi:hypothetical protein
MWQGHGTTQRRGAGPERSRFISMVHQSLQPQRRALRTALRLTHLWVVIHQMNHRFVLMGILMTRLIIRLL